MSATSTHAITCLPAADRCTRRGPGHLESPDQLQAAKAGPSEWRYGAVRRTDLDHVTVVDLEDDTSLAIWQHHHSPILLSAGTLIAVHEPAQLLMVKKVLATRVSVLVLGSPEQVAFPAEWHRQQAAITASARIPVPPTVFEDPASLFTRLTKTHECRPGG